MEEESVECTGGLGVMCNKAVESRNRIAKEGRQRERASGQLSEGSTGRVS